MDPSNFDPKLINALNNHSDLHEIVKQSKRIASLDRKYKDYLKQLSILRSLELSEKRKELLNGILLKSRQQISPILTKKELRCKLDVVIKNNNIIGKKKDFLMFLSKDFEPKFIREIVNVIHTRACTKLKERIQKILLRSGFIIVSHKGKYKSLSTYQLKYVPISEKI